MDAAKLRAQADQHMQASALSVEVGVAKSIAAVLYLGRQAPGTLSRNIHTHVIPDSTRSSPSSQTHSPVNASLSPSLLLSLLRMPCPAHSLCCPPT